MNFFKRIINNLLLYLGLYVIAYIILGFICFLLDVVPGNILSNINYIIYIILAIILFINVIINLHRYINNKRSIVPVEFDLSDNITSCDAGYLYYRRVGKKQVVSLVLYAASKGILSLIKEDGKLYIKKIKEIPMNEEFIIKKAFFNSFDQSDIIETKNFKMNGYDVINLCRNQFKKNISKRDISIKIFYYGSLFLFFIIPYSLKEWYSDFYMDISNIISIISCILLVIMIILDWQNGILKDKYVRQVIGYRLYIKNVEKEKMELLFNDNPSMYYRILAYSYALGVTNMWIKELKDIKYFAPTNIDYNLGRR